MRLNTLIARVERVERDLAGYVRAACEAEEAAIVEMNRAQLKAGENAEGVLMNGGVYSPRSIAKRMAKGLPVDHVYLSFEGDMQGAMKVEFGDEGFAVVTTDWKQRLVDEVMRTGYWPSSGYDAPEYGPVFGLTAANKGELARRIGPRVGRKIRNRLLCGR